eukprot:TRINITY_DN32180_c0_g1_i1.p1 TRINITY_DN32180_c0_g1~~TRINITY_DN32180_c0_g1_i1.p1  ORF type:complete len:327 (+),score=104.87 TRINITY_DN32180_c0_g1_i1:40-1020(+)
MRRACAQVAAHGAVGSVRLAPQRRWEVDMENKHNQLAPAWTPAHGWAVSNKRKLDTPMAQKMGRVGLVVGGTGLLGKSVCQELAARHVKTFSISRRGGVDAGEMKEHLDMLDEVHWIEGDVEDLDVWGALEELVRDLNEVVICLPRTLEGARLAALVVDTLYEMKSFPYQIALVSVPHFWPQVDSETRRAWGQTEETLRSRYPEEHLIVRPGEMYSTPVPGSLLAMRQRLLRFVHKRLLHDDIDNIQNLSALTLAMNRFKETQRSAKWIPPSSTVDVASACLTNKLPDLAGGHVQDISTYEIATMRFRAIPVGPGAESLNHLEEYY